MIREGINGFCMALADSVPGVSGGTVAFIMGFYDKFIGSINSLAFGNHSEKKAALKYLLKLALGWAVGMSAAVFALSALFESHIYTASSLFIGFILGSIPLIIQDEKESFKKLKTGFIFSILGIALVAGVSLLNRFLHLPQIDLSHFSFLLGGKLFFIGMIAISAMFLPGISGSTLLLVFGAYLPVISALREILSLHLSYLPCIMTFGFGIITGAFTVVRGIKFCLEKFRSQTVYMILGMMIGSIYPVILGPESLKEAESALSLESFTLVPCVIGIALVVTLQLVKENKAS